jgi:hypothetical protein
VDRATLVNAFLPASEIEDPHRFAGRRDQIRYLSDALHVEGSIPLILGQRGLGKSSLAVQMSRIAQGDVELLEELGLRRRAVAPEQAFITFYVNCSDGTKNLSGLLQAMINAVEALTAAKRSETADEYRLVDKTTRRGLSLKLFKHETTRRYEHARTSVDTKKFSAHEKLVHLTESLTDVYGQPVLFVVDEFDRIAPIKGLASFLKSHSSRILKFAFAGIGMNQSELIADHESLPRQLVPVNVPRMSKPELESIVERTEEFLVDNGGAFTFSTEARSRLSSIASGYPWFVHVIGQAALIDADDDDVTDINVNRIDRAIASLATGRYARQYYDTYQRAVKDSISREYVLRLCALWNDEYVPTSEIYPQARNLGVTGPSTYIGHLTSVEYGRVLAKSRTQSRALYRFHDEMFKVYARVRTSIYEGVKEKAERQSRA